MKKYLKCLAIAILFIFILPISTMFFGCNENVLELTANKIVSSACTLIDNAKDDVKNYSNSNVNNCAKKLFLENKDEKLNYLKSSFNGIFYMFRACLSFVNSADENIQLNKIYEFKPEQTLVNASTLYIQFLSENDNKTGVIVFNEVMSDSMTMGKINVLFDNEGNAYELRLVGGPKSGSNRQLFVGRINTSTISIISCALQDTNLENYLLGFNSGNFTSVQAKELGSNFLIGYLNDNSYDFVNSNEDPMFNNVFNDAYNIIKVVKIDNNLLLSQDAVEKSFTYGQDFIDKVNSLRNEYFI